MSSVTKTTEKPRAKTWSRINPKINFPIFVIKNINPNSIMPIKKIKDIFGHQRNFECFKF